MPFLDSAPEVRRPAPGVELLTLPEARFKRAQVQIHFDRPLDDRSPARTLLCRLLEQGTSGLSSRMEISRALEQLFGAGLEIDGDRLAEMHRVTIGANWVGERFLPEGGVAEEALGLARSLLEDPMRGVDGEPFRPDVFEREQRQLVRQIRSLADDRATYAQERFLAELCDGEPYGRPPYGDAETVAALDLTQVEEARTDLLDRATVTALAFGEVDPAPVEAALARWFGTDGPRADARRETPPEPVQRAPGELRTLCEAFEVDQARFHLGFRIPTPATPAELEDLVMANSLFGAGTSSRLFKVVREERSLAYGIYSSLRTLKGLLVVEAGIDAGSFEGVRDEVLHQVNEIAAGNFTEEELAMTRAGILNDLNAVGDSPASLSNFFARERLLGFHRTPAQRAAQLGEVTREGMAAAASNWMPDLVYLLAPEKALAEVA